MTELFRGMREDANGMPEICESSRGLGIRPGFDVPVIHPSDLVGPGQGGMSVSPDDPRSLPYFRRPPALGGTRIPFGAFWKRTSARICNIVPTQRVPVMASWNRTGP